jgi:hypothetical protein
MPLHKIPKRRFKFPVALVDASHEELPNCLGVVVGVFDSVPIAMLAELDYQEGTPNTRTRVVRLKQKIPVGTRLDPRVHLLPVAE